MRSNDLPALTPKIRQDIHKVVDYLWRDEKRHYGEGFYRKDHIFRVLKRLAKAAKYTPSKFWKQGT